MALETYRYDAEKCVKCKGCTWVDHIYMPNIRHGIKCPSIAKYLFDAYSPHGRLNLAVALLDGEIDCSPKLLDIIYTCQLCGACDVGCKRNLDLEPLLVLEGLREKCVRDGKGPMPEHKKVADNIENSKNRYGASPDKRRQWLPEEVSLTDKADLLYFAGCASSYLYPDLSQATARILSSANTGFAILSNEWCCGHPLFETGQLAAAGKIVEHNMEAIKKSGAHIVITSCAECYKTLKVDYPKALGISTDDLGFRVVHVVEYIKELMDNDRLKLIRRIDIKIAYHDACNLGRLSEPWVHWEGKRKKYGILDPPKEYRRGTHGIYNQPRDILRAIPGVELVEMDRAKENAWCCGAGGGVREAFKDFAQWTAAERLEEAEAAGAEAIVSSCPYCRENLRDAVSSGKEKLAIYDITEIVLKAISPQGGISQ